MAVVFDQTWPAVPIREEMLGGMPVLGETDARIAGALNHLAYVRARRRICHCEEHLAQPGIVPPPSEQTVITFTPLPEARHLVLIIEYVAPGGEKGNGGTSWATLTASLRKLDGTVIDIGCHWSEEDGSLPVGVGVVGNTRTVTTGELANDVEAGGAVPGPPRMLYLEELGGGAVEVLIEAEWCAVTGVSGWDATSEEK